MREIKTIQLVEMQKQLKYMQTVVDSALKIRRSLIEDDTVTQHEKNIYMYKNTPSDFYSFKFEDKGVWIDRVKDYYLVCTYNYRPEVISQTLLLRKYIGDVDCTDYNREFRYKFYNFESCLYYFFKCIEEIFTSIKSEKLPSYRDELF